MTFDHIDRLKTVCASFFIIILFDKFIALICQQFIVNQFNISRANTELIFDIRKWLRA